MAEIRQILGEYIRPMMLVYIVITFGTVDKLGHVDIEYILCTVYIPNITQIYPCVLHSVYLALPIKYISILCG